MSGFGSKANVRFLGSAERSVSPSRRAIFGAARAQWRSRPSRQRRPQGLALRAASTGRCLGGRGVIGFGYSSGRKADELPGSMEDGKRAVWVFMHPHLRLDVVAPVRLFGDLQHAPLVADAIIVAHHPLLLDAKDVFEIAHKGQEGGSLFLRLDREAGVERRHEAGGEPGIRRLDAVYP